METNTRRQPNGYKNKQTNNNNNKMSQMEYKYKAPEKELNKMEISNLTDVGLKTLVIRILHDLGKNFNKETENIKMEMES